MIIPFVSNTESKVVTEHRGARKSNSFEQDAIEVASNLRTAVAAVISALPERVSGGTDLDRQLSLGSTASWHLHSFATALNPLAAIEFLPGRRTIMRMVQAAHSKGLPEEIPERLRAAYDQFEAFMQEHSGDRPTLASLVSGVTGNSGTAHLARRRTAFRVESDLWGLQARTHLRCTVFHPGEQPGVNDAVLISGDVEVRSLRRGTQLRIAHRASVNNLDTGFQRLSPTIHVLEDFCSKPVPEMTASIDSKSGQRTTKVIVPGVGKSNSIDFFIWEYLPDTNQGVRHTVWSIAPLVRLPVELLVCDLLVPHGWVDPMSARAAVCGNLTDVEKACPNNEDDRMPMQEEAVYLGTDLNALQTPDVPRYPEMIRHVLQKQGWDKAEFDIFRCQVKYPVLHTLISLQVGIST